MTFSDSAQQQEGAAACSHRQRETLFVVEGCQLSYMQIHKRANQVHKRQWQAQWQRSAGVMDCGEGYRFYFERHGRPLNRASLTGRPSPSLLQCEWIVETNVKGKGCLQKPARLQFHFHTNSMRITYSLRGSLSAVVCQ